MQNSGHPDHINCLVHSYTQGNLGLKKNIVRCTSKKHLLFMTLNTIKCCLPIRQYTLLFSEKATNT
jgi:hypothetical protein